MYLQSLINRRTLFKNCLPWESKIPQFAQFYLYFFTQKHIHMYIVLLCSIILLTHIQFLSVLKTIREKIILTVILIISENIYTFWKERKKEIIPFVSLTNCARFTAHWLNRFRFSLLWLFSLQRPQDKLNKWFIRASAGKPTKLQ